jgi:tRNA G37 N-methylase TrmD
MRISLLTIFPDFFPPALAEGMIRAAREKGRLTVDIVGLREFTDDSHRTTDDYPFGGGVGMIMKIEPIHRALRSLGLCEPAEKLVHRPSDGLTRRIVQSHFETLVAGSRGKTEPRQVHVENILAFERRAVNPQQPGNCRMSFKLFEIGNGWRQFH